ncbi:hypothetical protein ACJJTC_003490 [Scirpophaga incertulas]
MNDNLIYSANDTEFSVRIVVCDHYLTKPVPGLDVIYSDFRGSDIKQVPVLRIFGPAADGRKTCLHVHGVFPYFYIPCPTPNPKSQLLYQIAASLDKALNIALKQATSSNQHVYKISLVKGLPFYGFHNKDHLYLKVFLYSPNLVKQAVELFSNGAIMGQTFQPHESHLNFTLQFFIDFNLFGMSNVDLQTVLFRKSGCSQKSIEPISDSNKYAMQSESICFYEADCLASHIINRQRIGRGDGIENPGLEEVWKQEIERRKQLNISLASKSLSQGRIKSEETESHYKHEQIFSIKLLSDLSTVNSEHDQELIHYPAESLEGSQLLDAVDVSVHLPEKNSSLHLNNNAMLRNVGESVEDLNLSVDESIVLSSTLSMHYSQVLLDSEDLNLVDMLQDMDQSSIEEDSIMGTPTFIQDDIEPDDAEYSQIFIDETISNLCKTNEEVNSPTWNDSFWDGANIPQLDGTCDDDHVKKVRKRKQRPLRLGLSKRKDKNNKSSNQTDDYEIENKPNLDISASDEINVSRETINSISSLHLKKSVKQEPPDMSVGKNDDSISNLVNKISTKFELKESKPLAANAYDIQNRFVPEAGSSVVHETAMMSNVNKTNYISDQSANTSDDSQGILSFYDTSKVFDLSFIENKLKIESLNDTIENLDTPQKISIHSSNTIVLTPIIKPPTRDFVVSSLHKYNIPTSKTVEPFYSDPNDVGDKIEIGQMLLKLRSKKSRDQKPFDKVLDTTSIEEWRQLLFLQTNEISDTNSKPDTLKTLLAGNKQCILQPAFNAPTTRQVREKQADFERETIIEKKIDDKDIITDIDDLDNSQAIGLNDDINKTELTPDMSDKSTVGLKNTSQLTMQQNGSFLCFGSNDNQNINTPLPATVEMDYLTLMLAEVHTSTRGDLYPDPALDSIQAVFIMVTNDCPPDSFLERKVIHVLVVDNGTTLRHLDRCVYDLRVSYFQSEIALLDKVVELVKSHDPDIMCGYEMEMNSWGYIFERAQLLGLEIVKEVSRITEKNRQKRWKSEDNEFEGRIIGRVTFNVWRLFRHELALSSYSFENCMYEILKERVPKYSHSQLTEWWNNESRIFRWIPVEYYMTKLKGTVRMLEKLDIINRTSELARIFGLQWWEVLSRGSQFRVESLMLRAARPLNLIALSPTVKQRAAMRAPECLPLIFEPESRFYSDPVIVLDFQSLYPSMMIAYNYCFSTCIGRVQNINGDSAYEFGAWKLRIPKSKLQALVANKLVHWSPVGVGFVKSSVRRGVLPALLRRILAARQAVKKNMKQQTDEAVKKAMHSRQLGLKLIANVTYGYTAANFSGRMPCVEVADSVVAKGRETLERAIKLVRDNSNWNVKVVYGDTDSMFVLVPGASRAEAFRIGQEIADAVTADNPSPVALKLEKVYQPCILQTKKRYVGYMYESPDQECPVYEAKGIETVRRDGCPAGVKLLRSCLCELFSSGDMSAVKRTVQSALARLAAGRVPLPDLAFTREYHGPAGYRPAALVPPNEIAKYVRMGHGCCTASGTGAPATGLPRWCRPTRSPSTYARATNVEQPAVRARRLPACRAGAAQRDRQVRTHGPRMLNSQRYGPAGYRPAALVPPNEIAKYVRTGHEC